MVDRNVHILVSGRVQGVWFRGSTAKVAEALDLVGWVRNLPDGRVEIEAQGPAPKIEEFIAWCRIGPPRASVDRLEIIDIAPVPRYSSFEVRRP
jgi:acylphosphatase